MNNIVKPRGRKSIPSELVQFGRHLVYSEGTKTEPLYIESLKKEIADKYKCSINDISIIIANKSKSYNTTGLIKFALDDIDDKLKKGEIINHVWFLFDKDDFPKSKFNEACVKAKKLNNSSDKNIDGFKYNTETGITYHCCWSNESFELWLYLYFEYLDVALTRDEYVEKINAKLALYCIKYEKNMNNLHQTLVDCGGSLNKAITLAKRLVKKNGNGNPSTTMYEFAEYFKAYLKE